MFSRKGRQQDDDFYMIVYERKSLTYTVSVGTTILFALLNFIYIIALTGFIVYVAGDGDDTGEAVGIFIVVALILYPLTICYLGISSFAPVSSMWIAVKHFSRIPESRAEAAQQKDKAWLNAGNALIVVMFGVIFSIIAFIWWLSITFWLCSEDANACVLGILLTSVPIGLIVLSLPLLIVTCIYSRRKLKSLSAGQRERDATVTDDEGENKGGDMEDVDLDEGESDVEMEKKKSKKKKSKKKKVEKESDEESTDKSFEKATENPRSNGDDTGDEMEEVSVDK